MSQISFHLFHFEICTYISENVSLKFQGVVEVKDYFGSIFWVFHKIIFLVQKYTDFCCNAGTI